jgi:PAS domain S-box-containing protein
MGLTDNQALTSSRTVHSQASQSEPEYRLEGTGDGRPSQSLRSAPPEVDKHPSEERFRLFVESVQDYAIFTIDAGGHITSWNVGAQRIKRYAASEVLGKHFSLFFPEEDARGGKPQRLLEKAASEGRTEDEGWRIRKGGEKFWAQVTITAIRDASGRLIGFGKVTRDLTERMLAQRSLLDSQRKLRDSEKSLRALSLHLLRMQDEERRRIGREIHDSLGQYLVALKMKLDGMTDSGTEEQNSGAAECSRLVEECVKEVRTISYLLYPPMLEEVGLRSAIPWYLDGFSKRSGIKTSFEITPEFKRLARDTELVLFRVLQESLTNVQRHSGSDTADVRLLQNNDTVVLELSDRGKGMTATELAGYGPDWTGSPGVGLRGMSERLQQIGGSLEIDSDGTGTQMRATVPIEAPAVCT